MMRKLMRGLIGSAVATVVVLVLVDESRGFFGSLQRRWNATAAMYGTVCNPCGQQLVCNYVPQTCYRVQYATVPVTTYRPVTSCDPCTGCPTTCMRPTTCYMQQAQYVPYQTFRLVYSVAQPACGTTATAYYPTTAAVGGCATCAAPAARTSYAGQTFAAPNYAVSNYAVPAAATAPVGCATCNQGATTTYYAPSATTSYYPTLPANAYYRDPAATSALPQGNVVYSYPTNSTAGGYQYGPSSGIPASSYVPSTSNYVPSAAAPTYSGPAYANPSGYGASASPTYTTPNYSASGTGVPMTSGAALAPTIVPSPAGSTSHYPPAATIVPQNVGQPLTPLGGGSTSADAGSPSSSNYTPGPTPTFAPTPAPGGSSDSKSSSPSPAKEKKIEAMKPIPDPLMSEPAKPTGPKIDPMSAPRLVDPQDRTAAAWPVSRAWGYAPVAASVAARTPVVTASATSEIAAPAARDGWRPATLQPIVPARSAGDADGWRSTAR